MTANHPPVPQLERTTAVTPRKRQESSPFQRPSDRELRTAEAGGSLVTEARLLMANKKWKDSLRVLEAATRLRPADRTIDELRAVSAAHARKPQVTKAALSNLAETKENRVGTWQAVAQVALANHRYEPADEAARQGLKADSQKPDGWYDLAAAYAGRGWFEEAEECLAQADALSHLPHSNLGRWRVGRAVNHWAITRTITPMVTLIAFIFLGLLGVAIGLSTPMLVREFRIRQLDPKFTELATLAWHDERKFRLLNASLVATAMVGWFLLLSLGAATN